MKKEEEKNKTTKEESPKKNIILNKTYAKPVKTVSNFNNNFSKNNISQIIIKTNLINYNNSLKLSGSNVFSNLVLYFFGFIFFFFFFFFFLDFLLLLSYFFLLLFSLQYISFFYRKNFHFYEHI